MIKLNVIILIMSNKRNLDVVNHYNSMCNIIPQYKQISLPSPAKKKTPGIGFKINITQGKQ